MKKTSLWLILILGIFAGSVEGHRNEPDLIRQVEGILEEAEMLEVLSVNPNSENQDSEEYFHHHKIIGRTVVTDANIRKNLVNEFLKGMKGNITVARCFAPGHGLIATAKGKAFEFLICFACSNVHVYAPSTESEFQGFAIGKEPAKIFDKILLDAGIPKSR